MEKIQVRLSQIAESQEKGDITLDFVEPFKIVMTSEKTDITFWVKSGIWSTNGDPKTRKTDRGLETAFAYLQDPEGFVFPDNTPKSQRMKSKEELMSDGEFLLSEIGVPYEWLGQYGFRIKTDKLYIDYWPTTGKWREKTGKVKYGSDSLSCLLKKKKENGQFESESAK